MASRLRKGIVLGAVTALLGAGAGLVPLVLEFEENAGLDWLFTLRGPIEPPDDVAVVSIANDSAVALGIPVQPDRWPRALHADLIGRLTAAGAAVIAFDIIFAEPRMAEDDRRFAAALEAAGNVVLLERLRSDFVPVGAEAGRQHRLVVDRREPPLPQFKEPALATAPFPLPVVPVKVSQFWTFGRSRADVPSLPAVALQAYALPLYGDFVALLAEARPALRGRFPADAAGLRDAPGLERWSSALRSTFRADPRLGPDMLARLDGAGAPGVEADAERERQLRALIALYQGDDSRYLNYYGPQRSLTTLPYHEALRLTPDGETGRSLRGKAVFVGFSERQQPEQQDTFYSVYSERSGLNLSGVEIAATAFANLLDRRSVRPLGMPTQLLLLLGWGFGVALLLAPLPTGAAIAATLLLGPSYVGLAAWQFAANDQWLPLIVPVFLQLPMLVFGIIAWDYAHARARGRRVQGALGYYLPPSIVDQLAQDAVDLKGSAQLLHGTCLATDADQYTTLSERLAPDELRGLLNDYYGVLFQAVHRHGGVVSDIVGDSMVAIWAAARPDPAMRANACRSALDILADVERFNRFKGHRELPTRIGLDSGDLLLGSVGAESHFEYRAVGDIVNTASRIQGLNKQLGTRVLVSAATLTALPGFAARDLGEFLLLGKRTPLRIFELTGIETAQTAEQLALNELFTGALEAFRSRDWAGAAQRFERVLQRFELDGPARFYRQLCRQYRAAPPAGDWSGAVSISEK